MLSRPLQPPSYNRYRHPHHHHSVSISIAHSHHRPRHAIQKKEYEESHHYGSLPLIAAVIGIATEQNEANASTAALHFSRQSYGQHQLQYFTPSMIYSTRLRWSPRFSSTDTESFRSAGALIRPGLSFSSLTDRRLPAWSRRVALRLMPCTQPVFIRIRLQSTVSVAMTVECYAVSHLT